MNYFNIDNKEYNLILNRFKKKDFLNLHNCTILITGGTGFIGKWVVGSLLKIDDKYKINIKLIIISRQKRNILINKYLIFSDKRIRIITKDVKNIKKINSSSIKYCIHLASDTNYKNVNDKKYLTNTIVKGGLNLLNLIKKNKITNIIYASSGAVYGNLKQPINGYKENMNTTSENYEPKNYYGLTKNFIEKKYLFSLKDNKYNLKILRIFTLIGQHLPINSHYAIADFSRNSLSNKNIIIKNNPKNLRSYLYIGDLTTWIIKILITKQKKRIYNIGSDKKINILNLAKKIIRLHNSKSKIIYEKKITKITNDYIPNIDVAKKDGFKIYTSLNKSILKYTKSN